MTRADAVPGRSRGVAVACCWAHLAVLGAVVVGSLVAMVQLARPRTGAHGQPVDGFPPIVVLPFLLAAVVAAAVVWSATRAVRAGHVSGPVTMTVYGAVVAGAAGLVLAGSRQRGADLLAGPMAVWLVGLLGGLTTMVVMGVRLASLRRGP